MRISRTADAHDYPALKSKELRKRFVIENLFGLGRAEPDKKGHYLG